MGAKWTRGEIALLARDGTAEQCREVLQYLDERGPSVIDWDEDRVPCESCGRLEGHSYLCIERARAENEGEDRADRAEARDTDIDQLRGGT